MGVSQKAGSTVYNTIMSNPLLSWMMGGGPDPTVHKAGVTTNYANEADRTAEAEYMREQRAKGGRPGGGGWNSRGLQLQLEPTPTFGRGKQGGVSKQHTRENYPLGAPSAAWWEKFGRWGPQGPVGNTGWRATLTQAPAPQSTVAPSQRYKQEVIQTQETRKEDWAKPFQFLTKNANIPRMNPQLAHMYVKKNTEVGAVRRTTERLF